MEETSEPDERWLQYYILGKIAEKKQKEPAEYLQYYMTASTLLDENKATYPEKIFYNSPQHLAVEALELHYRIHASVLKYLELHEGKDIPNSLGQFFKKCLSSSSFIKNHRKLSLQILHFTSFQEQFLNSLNKPIDEENIKPVEEENADLQ
ncbi:hypothetical protein NQ317_010317 [Molorchus minor]|uniref:Uncharacterized protein n=1 Tax=Molorchus minor TaxID=1323400 RepID=A0ABQ9IZ73_9CUCU|nr:hypothetical protein NQ317_010317 [Molorchus minor]